MCKKMFNNNKNKQEYYGSIENLIFENEKIAVSIVLNNNGRAFRGFNLFKKKVIWKLIQYFSISMNSMNLWTNLKN